MLVEHHIKYKEIHGIDEIILMERGKHLNLHRRLRKEGKCNIPVDELRVISTNAFKRTPKYALPERKKKLVEYLKKYRKYVFAFMFYTSLYPNIRLCERIRINQKTSHIQIDTMFLGNKLNKIHYIKER